MRIFISALLLSLGITYLFFSYFIITTDISINKRLWFVESRRDDYVKGSYILMKIDDERIPQYRKIIKKVACVEGERVTVKEIDFYINSNVTQKEKVVFCNGEYLGAVLKEDRDGRPLQVFTDENEVLIPQGFYFVVGSDIRSYDSRYFGLVARDKIITEVTPIL